MEKKVIVYVTVYDITFAVIGYHTEARDVGNEEPQYESFETESILIADIDVTDILDYKVKDKIENEVFEKLKQ